MGPRTLPNMHAQLFAKMDPTAEAYGYKSTLIMGWCPLPFWAPRSLPTHVQAGKFSLTSGVGALSLHFSRAQLLPLALSLECLGENKASILLHLTNPSCPAQGPIYLLPQFEYQCKCAWWALLAGRREGSAELYWMHPWQHQMGIWTGPGNWRLVAHVTWSRGNVLPTAELSAKCPGLIHMLWASLHLRRKLLVADL